MPRVLYDFNAEDDGELSIAVGETVTIVAAGGTSPHEGWVFVRKSNGGMGFVPRDYLSYNDNQAATSNVGGSSSQPDYNAGTSTRNTSNLPDKSTSSSSQQNNNSPMKMSSLVQSPKFEYQESDIQYPPRVPSPPSHETNTKDYLKRQQPQPLSQSFQDLVSTPMMSKSPTAANASSKAKTSTNSFSVSSEFPPKRDNVLKLSQVAHQVKNAVLFSSKQPDYASSKGPALTAALEKDDFAEVKKRNDEYFSRLLNNQSDTYAALTDMVETLSKKLNQSTQVTTAYNCIIQIKYNV